MSPSNFVLSTSKNKNNLHARRTTRIVKFKLDVAKKYTLKDLAVAQIIDEALQNDDIIDNDKIERLLNFKGVKEHLLKSLKTGILCGAPMKL